MSDEIRHDWTTDEVEALYALPLTELLFRAQAVHRVHHDPASVQRCTLLSIKTGGCPEDCGYCPQSAHYDTGVTREGLLDREHVRKAAQEARAAGSTRFCMGAAWREVRDGAPFDRVLGMVEDVAALGMEVCTTLGMLTGDQARRLKSAGLTAYNHNLDTSPEFYGTIITTRTYDDRLQTLGNVRAAGIKVCCGGIVGMGESRTVRAGLLVQLAALDPHPESVPVNLLVQVPGTPLHGVEPLDGPELVRTIAAARIMMPKSVVRLSAGRSEMSDELQALCLHAGASSIFLGDRLLTTPNPGDSADHELLDRLGVSLRVTSATVLDDAPVSTV
jgi:biotin synthase